MLFNITADPTEHHDISEDHPDIVRDMLKRLDEIEAGMIPPDVAPETRDGNPNNFGGNFETGWCQAQPAKPDSTPKGAAAQTKKAPKMDEEDKLVEIELL